MSEETKVVEPTETKLSDAERTAVAEIVNATLNTTVETKAKQVYIDLANADRIEVGNELTPRWAKDVTRFLNAFAANRDGDKAKAQDRAKNYFDSRNGLTTSAEAFEEKEALRIIRSSNINKIQQMRVQSTLTDAAGKFLLPKPFLAEIFVTLEEFGVARRLFRGIPMGSKTLDLKDVATKPAIFWEGENDKIAETSIAFGESQLVAKKLAALLPWTMELQEDEVFGVVSLASQLFGETIAEAEDSAGFMGAGTGDTGNGEFTGVVNLANAETHTVGTGDAVFTDADFDDFAKTKRLLSQAKRRGARWFFHDSYMEHIETIKDLENRYIYRQPSAPGAVGTIWGDPIEFVDVMPAIGAADQEGTRFIAYGNPQNMLFGSRRGVTFDISREGTILGVDAPSSYSAFQQDGAILRVTQRLGFQAPLDDHFAVMVTSEV
jgi:HK97 family phage major capsid protein